MGAYSRVRTSTRLQSNTRIGGQSSAVVAIPDHRSQPTTSSDTPNRDITSEAAFDSAVQTLLLSALENGLDLRGAWEYRDGEAYPDLEVLVTELA